jgi:hypothetical protein
MGLLRTSRDRRSPGAHGARSQASVGWAYPVALFVAFSLSLLWPIFYTGEFFTFSDTRSYLRGGEKIWEVLAFFVDAPAVSDGAGAAASADPTSALTVNAEGKNVSGRSFTYSAFVSVLFKIGGPIAIAFGQAVLVTAVIAMLVTVDALASPRVLLPGAVLFAALTSLPWYVSYIMPDIFGSLVLLLGVILVRRIDELGFWPVLLLVAITGFAAAAHYGNMPLIFVVVVAALAIRLLRRRLSWKSAIAGVVAVSLAPLANLSASAVVLDEPSMVPRRLPIALSRSLADGPALWYLQEVCPEADYALCEAYGDKISADTNWFLFSDEGVLSLSKEQLDRVRDEELQILIGAFLAYPWEQTEAFLGNGAAQLLKVGIGGLAPTKSLDADFEPVRSPDPPSAFQDFFDDTVIPLVALASVLAFAGCALIFGLSARWVDMLAALGVGLLANAYIYGGLSAPIDRYQGRLAWIIPLLLVLYLAETATRRRGEAKA